MAKTKKEEMEKEEQMKEEQVKETFQETQELKKKSFNHRRKGNCTCHPR